MVWRDSVGVESSRSELKSECADIFHQSSLWLLRHTDEPQSPGGYCHIWAIEVCAAVKGMVFKQFTLG